jgi:hypothetical protein
MGDIFEFHQLSEFARTTAVEVMVSVLESKKYAPAKTTEWNDAIGSRVITLLKDASPNFKYIVSTTLVQKTGSGLHFDMVACWDSSTDGAINAKYESDYIICICSIIGVAL